MEKKSTFAEWFRALRTRYRPTRNNLIWMIVSLVLALFLWVYIATTISGTYSLSFTELPIVINAENSRAAGFGLSVLSPPSESLTVDVTISGSRATIGGLSRDDLEAYVDFNSTVISDSVGRQSLPVRLRSKSGTAVTNSTLSVTTVDVVMDKYTTREVLVGEVSCRNLSGSDNEVIIDSDNITVNPSVVNISGPSTALDRLDHLRVRLEDNEKLSQTKSFDCSSYDLIDADGSIVSENAFTVQTANFAVTVPVYYIHELPVTVRLSSVPSGFDVSTVMSRLHLITDQTYDLPQNGTNTLKIRIKTEKPENKAKLNKLEVLELEDTIPLSSLSLGGTGIELAVRVDEDFEVLSDFDTVTVTMDESNLIAETRWISNSDVEILNPPSGYEIKKPSGSTRITIIGPPEEVSMVSESDIKATLNLMTASVPEDDSTLPPQTMTISLPSTVSGVWVSPLPKVYLTATRITATTSPYSAYNSYNTYP